MFCHAWLVTDGGRVLSITTYCTCRRARESTARAEALAAQTQQALKQQQADMKEAALKAEAERALMLKSMQEERAAAAQRAEEAQRQFMSAIAAA